MALNERSECTGIVELSKYPANKYNVLIPVKSMQEISPIHRVMVNEVHIDAHTTGQDVYEQEKAREGNPPKLALTKKGLAKLMAAANIQIVDSRPIYPQKCERCFEVAQRTRLAPQCGTCEFGDDVAHQVTIAVPEPSGTHRIIKATKELRMKDEKGRMTPNQFKQFFPYRTEHCETKTLNRALREALMVKTTYAPDELSKPFAVALVVPNFSDPEMKAAAVARYTAGTNDLFGGTPAPALQSGPVEQPKLSLGDGREVDRGTGEVSGFTTVPDVGSDDDDLPLGMAGFTQEPEPIPCEGEECGKIIEPYTDRNNVERSVEELIDISTKLCGRKLCGECIIKAVAAKQKAGGGR
jgi:hypothetical protein